jgi:NADH:ubiquinone oxidoreductase subunit 5 (subunit L)/multisubunit Na+/H+ antiporter MnhA subunit
MELILYYVLGLPFLAAVLVKLLPKKISLLTGLLATGINFILLVFMGIFYSGGNFYPEISIYGINFFCDKLSFIFAAVSLFCALMIYLYSLGYFSESTPEDKNRFSFWGLIFIGSMLGVLFSDNLISLYLFWELAGLCSWRLIGFYREKQHLFNADKALMITGGGAGIMLLSLMLIYLQTGSINISELSGTTVTQTVFILFFVGVITKSATLPFHSWLPAASVAPTPVTAFLHAAVLVKIGLYGIARIFGTTLAVSGSIVWAGYLALLSSFVAGFIAFRENDIKKILAYSTVSQLGFMLAGFLAFNIISFLGTLVFYTAHAVGKGCLFMCAGIIEKLTGTRDIRKMNGLMKKIPMVSFSYLICMLSVMGLPPVLGFWGKFGIITGMVSTGKVIFGFFAILTSILTLFYLLRSFKYVFMGRAEEKTYCLKNGNPMVISVVIMAFLSLLLGLLLPLIKGGLN